MAASMVRCSLNGTGVMHCECTDKLSVQDNHHLSSFDLIPYVNPREFTTPTDEVNSRPEGTRARSKHSLPVIVL
eukprot:9337706-Pyramimonas_sp.AAC.1